MPTTRPRILITETDPVARALDAAAQRWPEDSNSRSRLLLHLVEEGHRVLLDRQSVAHEDRLAAIERTSGALTGSYPADHLRELRED
jgi:hypothetical protein